MVMEMMSLLLVISMGFVCSSHAALTLYVGGRDGWTLMPSENYTHWSARYRFQINDTLVFKYKKGGDSVLVVNKEDYNKCNKNNPIQNLTDGDTSFKLNRPGPFYFISGHDQSCDKGQKLAIVVLSEHHPKTAPTHAPPPTPPSTTPPPTPQSSPPATTPPPPAETPTNAPPSQSPPPPAETPTNAPPSQSPPPPAETPTNAPPTPNNPTRPPAVPSPSPEADGPQDYAPAPAPSAAPESRAPFTMLAGVSLVASAVIYIGLA